MPFDPFDPFANLTVQDQPQSPRRIPPLKKDEEESILSQLTGKVLGGVGYVGGSIGKVGRAVRGALGGKPEEMLAALPFSDALGITHEDNAVSGEDLAKQWGVLDGEGEKGTFELRDLVGPAIEAVTDPLSYATFGGAALSKGGGIAKKIGVRMPKGGAGRAGTTLRAALEAQPELQGAASHAAQASGLDLAGLMDQPLGGHVGLGIPFKAPAATFDLSPALDAARSLAGHLPGAGLAQKAGEALAPYGRSVAALFDKSRRGATTPLGIQAARGAEEGLAKVIPGLREEFAGTTRLEQKLRELTGMGDTSDLIRSAKEGTLKQFVEERGGNLNPESASVLDQIMGGMDRMEGLARQHGLAQGTDTGQDLLDAYTQYGARQLAQLPKDTKGFRGPSRMQATPANLAAMEGRLEPLKNIPGGTVFGLNPLSTNPEFSGIASRLPSDQLNNAVLTNADKIRRQTLQMTGQDLHDLTSFMPEGANPTLAMRVGSGLTAAEKEQLFGVQNLINNGVNLTPEQQAMHEALGARFNDERRLADLRGTFKQGEDISRIMAGLDPQHAQHGIPMFGNHPLADTFHVAESRLKAASNMEAVNDLFGRTATATPGAGAVPINDALQKVGVKNLKGAQQAVAKRLGVPAGDNLMQYHVPEEAVKDALRYNQPWAVPQAAQPLVDLFDSLTNLTKVGQTTLWPSFHARNLGSGQAMNALTGSFSRQGVQDAQALLGGKVVAGASQLLPELAGMTDEQATRKLADLAFAHRVAGGQGLAGEVVGGGAQAESLLSKIPGAAPEKIGDILSQGVPRSKEDFKNLLGISGVGSYAQDVSRPVIAGRKIGAKVEDQNRLSAWITKLRQGYTPEQAAKEVLAAHVDYANATGFERNVMRRLVPFYSWQRGTAPQIVNELMSRPGGPTGQLLRASNDFRQQAGFVPSYVGQGMAVPVGKEDDGTQRYLSGLGLPHEQVLDMLKTGPHGAENTLMGLLGQLNPLVKAPLEYATGKQFFTGRNLEDLHDITGNSALDQLITNSPGSKFYTSARTLADERKDWPTALTNLLSGVKLTDVDMDKARSIEGRKVAQAELEGRPGVRKYTETYVRPEDMGKLSSEDIALLRLLKTMEEEGRKRAKQKKVGVKAG